MAWGNKAGDGSARAASGTLSFIGSEVTITGNVTATGDMHVDGHVDGDLTCGMLTLGSSGRVTGNITARKATLAGVVEGAIAVADLAVEKTAKLNGDVSYENLAIENGARVDGRLTQRGASSELKLVVTAGD